MNLFFAMLLAVNKVEQKAEKVLCRNYDRCLGRLLQRLEGLRDRVEIQVGLKTLKVRQNAVRAPRLQRAKRYSVKIPYYFSLFRNDKTIPGVSDGECRYRPTFPLKLRLHREQEQQLNHNEPSTTNTILC